LSSVQVVKDILWSQREENEFTVLRFRFKHIVEREREIEIVLFFFFVVYIKLWSIQVVNKSVKDIVWSRRGENEFTLLIQTHCTVS